MTKVANSSGKSSRGGSKKGERRGGRQKGTPNKKTQNIIDKLNALGYDPIESLVRLAQEAEDSKDKVMEFNACKELAQYVAPKRKAVEMVAEVTSIDLADDLTDTQRENLKKLL
jgi:hypothetical protein